MTTDATKVLLRRWYDEMWGQARPELIPELAGPLYTRHEMGGTRVVSAEEYRDQTAAVLTQLSFDDLRYGLVAEGDKVCAIGTWRVRSGADAADSEGKQWDWVQLFRAEEGRLVETWLSGIGMESGWQPEAWQHLRG